MPLSKKRDRKKVDRQVKPNLAEIRQGLEETASGAVVLLSNLLDVKPDVPIYNPKRHHEGDVVRKWSNGKWVEVTVPALDMDGNVIGGD